jgi:hypothetical protein
MRFNVRVGDGRTLGSAVWSRVNVQSAVSSFPDSRGKSFGGVPVSVLRRIVIDRMVAEGGWVTNDVQRQFGERSVFVVTAQSVAANGERRAQPSTLRSRAGTSTASPRTRPQPTPTRSRLNPNRPLLRSAHAAPVPPPHTSDAKRSVSAHSRQLLLKDACACPDE